MAYSAINAVLHVKGSSRHLFLCMRFIGKYLTRLSTMPVSSNSAVPYWVNIPYYCFASFNPQLQSGQAGHFPATLACAYRVCALAWKFATSLPCNRTYSGLSARSCSVVLLINHSTPYQTSIGARRYLPTHAGFDQSEFMASAGFIDADIFLGVVLSHALRKGRKRH